jgi:hypothetical protein
MKFPSLPPYLISKGDQKQCSACGATFGKHVKPSISRAFREHVEKEHRVPHISETAKLTAPGNYHHKVK